MKLKINVGSQISVVVFILLTLFTFWFTTVTATNLLKADDWRFILIFYKKWLEGSFQFRDLFSDHHPMALHPLVYLFNAKFFSLQGIYEAWFGLIIKTITGFILLWKLFHSTPTPSSNFIAVLFPLYIVCLFFGMNEFAEFIWPLLTYESSMTFFCGLVSLVVLDRVLTNINARISVIDTLALALIAILSLLLMGTYIKLFLLSILLALLIVAIYQFKITKNVAIPFIIITLSLVMYTIFIAYLDLPKGNMYSITLASVGELLTNWFANISFVAFGLAAGLSNTTVFAYPSFVLNIFAAICLIIAVYSIFVFYQERMWESTLIPVVLVFFLMFTYLGTIVFRSNESPLGVWPLYIPRYFPTYHMGWIGVVWIYYYKFRTNLKLGLILVISAPLILGIALMLFGFMHAWRSKPYVISANNLAEVAVCKFANGEQTAEEEIPRYIRGASFSHEGVQILQQNHLNIFNDHNFSYRCTTDSVSTHKP